MSSEEGKKDPPKIITDEDWKQRVKAEDAALDQKLREESEEKSSDDTDSTTPSDVEIPDLAREAATSSPEAPSAPDGAHPLPPADFSTILMTFSTQAMVSLGLIPNPITNKPEVQLDLARHFIDMLAVLEQKTKGNLSSEESALLDKSLHELRMIFMEQQKNAGSS